MSAEHDILDDAFAALRDETRSAGAAASASATRARLLLATTQRRRRTMMLRVLVPIAAVLAVSSAWAAHDRFPALFGAAREAPETTREARQENHAPSVGLPSAAVAASASVEAPAATSAVRPIASEAVDPEETLYRAGHQAQFVTRDFGGALAAWDAYLAKHPRGRFAPEARYNRAIALLRLGRRDDARDALRPFADGSQGGYRQKEARELLDALEGD